MGKFFAEGLKLIEQGGGVMFPLLLVGTSILYITIERTRFFYSLHSRKKTELKQSPPSGRRERWIQTAQEARYRSDLTAGLQVLRTLVTVSSLLGLLGTITGMIAIFEKLSEGATPSMVTLSPAIARATIPTMVGMALSILGLFALYRFSGLAQRYSRSKS
jgi:biopolymer transport protein ExbB